MRMPGAGDAPARNCLRTIAKALDEAGFALADVVRATYYIVDHADADRVLAVCGEFLADIRPAATLLVVAGLYKPETKVESGGTARRRWPLPFARTTLSTLSPPPTAPSRSRDNGAETARAAARSSAR